MKGYLVTWWWENQQGSLIYTDSCVSWQSRSASFSSIHCHLFHSMETCSFIGFVSLHLIFRCCLVIEHFALPIKSVGLTQWCLFWAKGKILIACAPVQSCESVLSKAQVVKQAYWERLLEFFRGHWLSYSLCQAPRGLSLGLQLTQETPLYMAHLGSPSSSQRPAIQKYPWVFNGSSRFKWSSINQILPICWEQKSRDKGAERVCGRG